MSGTTTVSLASLGGVILILVRAVTYGRTIQSITAGIYENTPHLETFLHWLDEYRVAESSTGTASLGQVDSIAFANVSYAYNSDRPALEDVAVGLPLLGQIIGI